MTAPVLRIEDFSVRYDTARGPLRALREVDLTVSAGETLGIVGESGCGKSTLIAAIMRLLAPNAHVENGSIRFRSQELMALTAAQMRALRGAEISVVFQDPMSSLNPVLTIGRQMRDVLHRASGGTKEKHARATDMLRRVGIADAETQMSRYPHQLSGGMRQRVAIAMAMLTGPSLLIADEPTTALDATLEVQIIGLLQELQRDFGCSILFVSHHLGVIAEICDSVAVMYAGEVVEAGPMREVFLRPRHPYTRRLLECDPARIPQRSGRLPVIEGSLPDLTGLPAGCVFRERCALSVGRCSVERPRLGGGQHPCACHLAESGP